MRILGIDYGRKKIGVAVSDGLLAEPLAVLKVNSFEQAVERIIQLVIDEKIAKVVVGISEGQMARESQQFRQRLSQNLLIPVEAFDETLTTVDAQKLSQEAGIKRSKRQALEDAYAATIMLQGYLDSQ